MYCGDEVRAVVADLGFNCKFGSAGQDSPRHVFRSFGGRNLEDSSLSFGDVSLRCVKGNVDIIPSYTSEDIDWDATASLLHYGIEESMKVDPTEYPVLVAENYFDTSDKKDKLLEVLFEDIGSPGAHIMNNATLASFCFGRPTSLIVDLGCMHSRVVPVVDGYTIRQASQSSPLGCNWMNLKVLQYVEQTMKQPVLPWFESPKYMSPPHPHSPPNTLLPAPHEIYTSNTASYSSSYLRSSQITPSFRKMHIMDVANDIKQWTCLVPAKNKSVIGCSNAPTCSMPIDITMKDGKCYSVESLQSFQSYELPDGRLVDPDIGLCFIPEHILFSSTLSDSFGSDSRSHLGESIGFKSGPFSASASLSGLDGYISRKGNHCSIQKMIYDSVMSCDLDVRKDLLANICFVGGGALIDGMQSRIMEELAPMLPPSIKAKAITAGLSVEKQYAAWIGGSIISICGSFQQLWISKAEYDECGPGIHRKKCVH